MSFDEHLRHALGGLADRLQEETKRQLASISDELGDAFETEHTAVVERAVAEAKSAAEQTARAEILAAVAVAEAKSSDALTAAQEALTAAQHDARAAREAGKQEGLEIGRQEGRKAGHEEGRLEGFGAGREAGKQEGLELGKQQGLDLGKQQGLELGKQQGLQQGRQEGATVARQEGLEQARAELRAMELAANERLVDAIRAIDRGRSLSEILDTLVSCAGREAKRVGVLLVRSGQLRGWRFIGFGGPLDERRDFDVPSAGAGIVAEAARTGAAASADSATTASVPSFAELPPGREVFAVPVPMSGQVVAVLYADQGPSSVSDAEMRVSWPATLEVMARHAARCLEAITAFRAAQVLTERPDVPGVKGGAAPVRDDKEDADQSARRYAKLLVSEIKMYHEAAVVAGRREGDLGTRLGGEIARARALYEQRVPAEGRKGRDYFRDELVRTLADGNAALLEVKK